METFVNNGWEQSDVVAARHRKQRQNEHFSVCKGGAKKQMSRFLVYFLLFAIHGNYGPKFCSCCANNAKNL
jgi:hypothetical protein